MSTNPYDTDLDRNAANFVALSPLSFIERAAAVHPTRDAIRYGARRQDWRATFARCRRLASALRKRGIGPGDTVAAMLPNVPAMFEAHYGVPATGGVLNALNTRLDGDSIAFMLTHGGAKILLADREYAGVLGKALAVLGERRPLVVVVEDPTAPANQLAADLDYEALLAEGDPGIEWTLPDDEWNAIALNYTSGTTGDPKGVVTHHRGAYLNAVNNALGGHLPAHPIYLWTLPMFHCNGWCFPWTMGLTAGTSVCLRRVDAAVIFGLIRDEQVTHMCGAPVVYSLLINAPASLRAGITQRVSGYIAGAAPPAAIIEGCEKAGIDLTHVYGLTEVYGPAAICEPQDDWSGKPLGERAALNARQGMPYPLQQALTVRDPGTLEPVPADGRTVGELMFRGNVVMKGYLKNPKATEAAFAGGWFRTGDLGVMHPDGYAKITDRSKDVIISGGENVSSLEVEDVLHRHPAVTLAAVVAMPDDKWGEVPCAFVEVRADVPVSEAELVAFCKTHLAGFKVPKRIVFGELPKTSTGKTQKFVLRDQVKSASAITND